MSIARLDIQDGSAGRPIISRAIVRGDTALSDMRFFEDHNAVWNEWVDRANPPVRACVRADLVRTCLVEIMVTAAK